MFKKIEAVLRTSEFWMFLASVIVQAIAAPVPDDVKAAAWVYVVARVVSKIVKYKPAPAATAAAVTAAALLLLAPHAYAQTKPSTADRMHVTVNGGAMVITTEPNWSGASLGAGIGYNLHPALTVFGGYDHGFPVKRDESHLNLYRVVGNLHVLPDAFVGFGYAWFDRHTDGALAQLALTRQVMRRVEVAGMYAHVMSRSAAPDFEYVRVCVNYHLIGKE